MSKLHLTKFVGVTVYGRPLTRPFPAWLSPLTFACRVVWGIVCMCLAAPHNYAGFAAVRFFLGFAEGAVSPAFVTITSIWYQKSEHALRTGYVVCQTGGRTGIPCHVAAQEKLT